MGDAFFNLAQRLTFIAADLGLQLPAGQAAGGAGMPDGAGVAHQVSTVVAEDPGFFASTWVMLLIWGGVFVGMYFLMFRPQRKREKAMREMQSAIKTGDNIVTSGGLFGRVADVGTDCFVVEFGISGRSVKMPVLKNDVVGVREPVLTPPPKETEVK